MSPLQIIGQDDFAAGIIRGVAPDVQPGVGVANAINGLFNEDGDVYRRGGSTYFTPLAADANNRAFTFLWSGFLAGLPKTLVGDAVGMFAVDELKQWSGLGAPGLTEPCLPAVIRDLVYLPNGQLWGGAQTLPNYSTGTTALTAGSATATGTGTAWVANAEAGMILTIGGVSYRVAAVVTNTSLTLDRVAPATVATTAYTLTRMSAWTRPAALKANAKLRLCTIANRLVVAANNRIAFSEINKPYSFIADDFHDLPGGVLVMGMAAIRDTLLVFTNFGLWTITNMAYNLTDAAGNVQQTLSLLTPEVSLWREAGLCEWAGRIIAPCIDRVFAVDAISPPQPISNSIAPYYSQLVASGNVPGAAKVYRNHLFLPILNGIEPSAMLVCRLDRPVQGRQIYFPWSTFTGHAQKGGALDVSLVSATPDFVMAGRDRRLTSLRSVFEPAEAVAADADGTAHEFDVESRDFPTGNGQPNHVRKLRLRYSLEGPAQILAAFSYGSVAQTYEALRLGSDDYADVFASYASYAAVRSGGPVSGLPASPDDPERFWYSLSDQTPPDPGVDPVTWDFPQAKRVRYIRFRFRTESAVAKLVLHHLDFHVRQATHDR
ncbi:MAG TPA: hypothetical protein VK631_15265 [Solirubrobacteraceae bacterium]|nr:hypothetical protein [Solirubrobacteraceae bacterium]